MRGQRPWRPWSEEETSVARSEATGRVQVAASKVRFDGQTRWNTETWVAQPAHTIIYSQTKGLFSTTLPTISWAVFVKQPFSKQVHGWSCFFSLTKGWVGMKLKKLAYPNFIYCMWAPICTEDSMCPFGKERAGTEHAPRRAAAGGARAARRAADGAWEVGRGHMRGAGSETRRCWGSAARAGRRGRRWSVGRETRLLVGRRWRDTVVGAARAARRGRQCRSGRQDAAPVGRWWRDAAFETCLRQRA